MWRGVGAGSAGQGHTALHYCYAYKYTELGEYLRRKVAACGLRP